MSSRQILIKDMVDTESLPMIPDDVKDFYNNVSKSMLNQIRKRGIRKYSGLHVDRWLRLNFPINEDKLVVEKHRLAGSQVSKYLLRESRDYKIPLKEVKKLIKLDNELLMQQKEERKRFERIKYEVELIREQKRKTRPPKKKMSKISKIKGSYQNKQRSKNSIKSVKEIDYDQIYKQWMSHVESKSTSKSYWYIHEYIGRYILNFALEQNAPSINPLVVQEFLDQYGKGKAAKTMNHYTRVAKYFLEFCQSLY